MENSQNAPYTDKEDCIVPSKVKQTRPAIMHPGQIQKLVRLLDRSDIAEIEVNRAGAGLHLVLRKFKTAEPSMLGNSTQTQYSSEYNGSVTTNSSLAASQSLKAHMVGVFHSWLKPHGENLLVTAGDFVKPGQIIGTIEALNILNEVKATISGRVKEVFIQDGQFVEYGQTLILIENCEEKF